MRRTRLALLAALLPTVAFAQQEFPASRWPEATVTTESGLELAYRVLLPDLAARNSPTPLVLLLHGNDGTGLDTPSRSAFPILTDPKTRRAYPAYIVTPRLPSGESWADIDVQLAIPEMLDAIEARWPIDAARVYLVGDGAGSSGVWAGIEEQPSRYAAAVVIGRPGREDAASSYAMVPSWLFVQATDDAVVATARRVVSAVWAIRRSIRYTEYRPTAEGDVWTPWEEPRLLPWLFSQIRE